MRRKGECERGERVDEKKERAREKRKKMDRVREGERAGNL
jgi:hypothetical protein